jgi:hypothetical protein
VEPKSALPVASYAIPNGSSSAGIYPPIAMAKFEPVKSLVVTIAIQFKSFLIAMGNASADLLDAIALPPNSMKMQEVLV